MVWLEIVCDGCNDNPFGEDYRKGSLTRLKQWAKEEGWKTVKGKTYCPKCQAKLKANKEKAR